VEQVLWQGAAGTSVAGGIASLGMSMYGDLDDDVSAGDVEKCGYRAVLKRLKLYL
jgi:hypothetical protein